MKNHRILSIEAAVSGGSIALLDERGKVVEKWHSEEKMSRSEELLSRIAELLECSKTKREDMSAIAVSNGPGSYTGIRVGLATAMGLARALKIPCIGVSLLRALASTAAGERIVVVPIGRNGYCWQRFEEFSDRDGVAAGSGNLAELVIFSSKYPSAQVLAQSDAFQALSDRRGVGEMVDLGRHLAVAVGRASASADDGLQPFYAREISPSPAAGVESNGDNLIVRPFQDRDCEAVLELATGLALSPWTLRDYREELKRTDSEMIVAAYGLRIVGFLVGRRVPGLASDNEPDAEIYNIGVDRNLFRTGIGSRLIEEFLDRCGRFRVHHIWLEVRTENTGAIEFYRKEGFREFTVRPNFYRDPLDDGIVMRLEIPPAPQGSFS